MKSTKVLTNPRTLPPTEYVSTFVGSHAPAADYNFIYRKKRRIRMNKELQAIENSIMQWTFYVVTGAKNKWSYEPIRDANLLDNCYLCEHSSGITGTRECRDFSDDSRHPRCQACPYFKKYGFCCDAGKPAGRWLHGDDDHNPKDAQAFLEQLKTLRTLLK